MTTFIDNYKEYFLIPNIEFDEDFKFLLFLEVEKDIKIVMSQTEIIKDDIIIIMSEDEDKTYIYHKKIYVTENMLKSLCYQLCYSRSEKWKIIYNQLESEKYYYFYFVRTKDDNSIFQTNNYDETMIIARAILNENSLMFMRDQLFDRFITLKHSNQFDEYKVNLNNFETIDQHKFILFSSTIFWSYGLRENNDIDMYVSHGPLITKTKNFKIKLNIFEDNENNDVAWIGFGEKWTYFAEYLLKTLCDEYNIKSFDELIFNPKNHYYFCGIKMTLLDFEISRRLFRQRAKSIADLIAIKILLRSNLRLNNKFIINAKKKMNEKNNEIYNNDYMDKTIQKYLRNIYDMDFTLKKINDVIDLITKI
jgi:hypothetical protein